MGGILGGLSKVLFGSPDVPEADFEELAKLLKLGIEENRYNQRGLFTSFDWNPEKDTITQSINPQLQGGMDAMLTRVNQGSPGYSGAGRFQPLIDAYMAQAGPERRQRPEIPQRPPGPDRPEFTPYRRP